ncbi:hypothetical protein H0H93_013122 [Arthromyces matolae]|nr:hypothetical protein H0H93_013122 [Arthromyces matolae]
MITQHQQDQDDLKRLEQQDVSAIPSVILTIPTPDVSNASPPIPNEDTDEWSTENRVFCLEPEDSCSPPSMSPSTNNGLGFSFDDKTDNLSPPPRLNEDIAVVSASLEPHPHRRHAGFLSRTKGALFRRSGHVSDVDQVQRKPRSRVTLSGFFPLRRQSVINPFAGSVPLVSDVLPPQLDEDVVMSASESQSRPTSRVKLHLFKLKDALRRRRVAGSGVEDVRRSRPSNSRVTLSGFFSLRRQFFTACQDSLPVADVSNSDIGRR